MLHYTTKSNTIQGNNASFSIKVSDLSDRQKRQIRQYAMSDNTPEKIAEWMETTEKVVMQVAKEVYGKRKDNKKRIIGIKYQDGYCRKCLSSAYKTSLRQIHYIGKEFIKTAEGQKRETKPADPLCMIDHVKEHVSELSQKGLTVDEISHKLKMKPNNVRQKLNIKEIEQYEETTGTFIEDEDYNKMIESKENADEDKLSYYKESIEKFFYKEGLTPKMIQKKLGLSKQRFCNDTNEVWYRLQKDGFCYRKRSGVDLQRVIFAIVLNGTAVPVQVLMQK